MRLLTYISTIFVLLPLVLFLLFFKRNSKVELRVIFAYTIASLITDQIHTSSSLHYLILHIFTIIEYTFIAVFIYLIIKRKLIKRAIIVISICYYLFAVFLDRHFLKNEFDSLAASVECIIVVVYCILFYYEQINEPEITLIYSHHNFWIVTGFLIYFSGTLFLFIFAAGMQNEENSLSWNINTFCSIIENICLSIAFIMKKNQYIDSSESYREVPNDVFRD